MRAAVRSSHRCGALCAMAPREPLMAHSARPHAAALTASTYPALASARSTQAPHHSRCSSSAASSASHLHHAQVVTLQIVIVDMVGELCVDKHLRHPLTLRA